ncbi:MAG: hypothetical protein HY033_10235 [Ignavibacteriae bacterium]|nr:hypothetical protein [Ignavibacteria bacterium]MBI3365274.1 hypothetical protein [Ignavibacteriota bacterium]
MTHESESQLLGEELALALNDRENRSLYEYYARNYPESLLRKLLASVLRVPNERIKKSRGALFTYLLKQYAHSKHNNGRN